MGAAGIEFVYVIQGDHGLVKIGVTTNMDARLAQLRTASAFPLRPTYALAVQIDARQIEGEVNRRLDDHRCSGEWFDCPPQVAERTINEVAADFGIPIATTDSETFRRGLNARPAPDRIGPATWTFILCSAAAGGLGMLFLLQ
jgi:hypothetical protein